MWKASFQLAAALLATVAAGAADMAFKTDFPLVDRVPFESPLRLTEGSKAVYDVFIDGREGVPKARHEIFVGEKLEREDGVFWQVSVTYIVDGSSAAMRFLTPVEEPTFDPRQSAIVFVETPMIKMEVGKVQGTSLPRLEFVREETIEVDGKTFQAKLYHQQTKGERVDRFWFVAGVGPYRLVKAEVQRGEERRLYVLSAFE